MARTTKLIKATEFKKGMTFALPMGREATIRNHPFVGRLYVSFKTEHGKTRVEKNHEALVFEDTIS